jgi:hypothetical protein
MIMNFRRVYDTGRSAITKKKSLLVATDEGITPVLPKVWHHYKPLLREVYKLRCSTHPADGNAVLS